MAEHLPLSIALNIAPRIRHGLGLTLIVLTTGCSTAQVETHMNEVSLSSYQRGCAMRGQQDGLDSDTAWALCECHTHKAIEQTSLDYFIETTNKLGMASKEERMSGEMDSELDLMRSTFKACKTELNLL